MGSADIPVRENAAIIMGTLYKTKNIFPENVKTRKVSPDFQISIAYILTESDCGTAPDPLSDCRP